MSDARHDLERVVLPIAEQERSWRESLRTCAVDDFMRSYGETNLPTEGYVRDSSAVRAAYVRAHLDEFDN